jgi:hypothetical protein
MSHQELVYGLNKTVTGPGSLGIGDVKDEFKVRFVISNATLANVVRVRARITGQDIWTTIVDLNGNANQLVDVYGYDQIEVIVLVYSPSGNYVRVVAQSYDGANAAINIGGNLVGIAGEISFISSDSSVEIVADPQQGTIDFKAIGAAGSSPFKQEFLVSDWVSVGSFYELTISSATHGKTGPSVEIYELTGGIYEEVDASITVDASNNVIINVPQTPDLRFAGRVIII